MSEPESAGTSSRAGTRLWAAAALLVALLFCLPMLAGRVPYLADVGQIFYPLMDHLARGLKAGTLPLWNPDLAGGYFAHGAGQTAMLYPVNWALYGLAPMPAAFAASYVIHLCLAALGFFWFLRLLGLLPSSAALGALLYAFSGHAAGHHIHLNVVLTLAWLPWTLGALHRALERPCAGRVGWLGLAYGMMALAGHPQWLWLGTVVLGMYALVGPEGAARGADGGRSGPVWAAAARRVGVFLAGALLGGLIAAVQLLPTAQTARAADRAGEEGAAFTTAYSLALADVPRLLCPNIHGNPARGDVVVDPAHWWETAAFQGAAAWCLALALIAGYGPRGTGRYALVMILLGVILAFGEGNPLHRLLGHVPLVGEVRAPARYLLLALVGVAVAAAQAHTALVRGEAPRRPGAARWVAAGAPAVIVLIILMGNATFAEFKWAFIAPLDPASLRVPQETRADVMHNYFVGWEPVLIAASAALVGLWLGLERMRGPRWMVALPVALVAAELLMFWRSFVVTAPPEYYKEPPPYLAAAGAAEQWGRLLVVDPPSADTEMEQVRVEFLEFLAPAWGVPVLQGLEPLQPWEAVAKRHRAAAALVSDAPATLERGRRLVDLYGVRWLVSERDLAGAGLEPVRGVRFLYRNPAALPLAYAARNVVPAATLEAQERAVERPGFRQGVDCAVDAASAPGIAGPEGTQGAPPQVDVLEHAPGLLVARVTADSPVLLVYQQTWHPDWQATVEGSAASPVRCNAANMAVPVPASPAGVEVRLEFRSRATRAGLGLSLPGLLLAIILIAAQALHLRRARQAARQS